MSGGRIERGEIPRGIEVLVKKASVDADFYNVLLNERSKAAAHIGLDLDPSEAMMLDGIPEAQLIAIISSTQVNDKQRPAFMGSVAAAMLAAIGMVTAGCNRDDDRYETLGIDPDTGYLDDDENKEDEDESEEEHIGKVAGVRPDLPYIEEGEEDESGEDGPEGAGE